MEKRNMKSAARRLCVALPVLALMLAGCAALNGGQGSRTPDRIENAQPHNAVLTGTVESLQQQIWEGSWTPAAGGNLLVPCESNALGSDDSAQQDTNYLFYGSWSTTGEYEAPADLEAAAQELSSWLGATGWSDVDQESSESPKYWRVGATQEENGVAEAMVTWYPEGTIDMAQPHAVLDVDSTCSPAEPEA